MPRDEKRRGNAMNIEIAERLYELRRAHGYSQESLAEALDISRQAISKWERAESAPDMGNLIALADLYGITIDELVRPSEEVVSAADEHGEDAGDGMSSNDASEDATSSVDAEHEAEADPDRPQPPHASSDKKSVHAHGREYAKPDKDKRLRCGLRRFPFPLLVAVLVLFFVLVLGMWEYVWLFLTIPFYYWIARIVERDPNYREARGYPPSE